jgi:pentatricopeptide repeat protein
MQLAAIPLTVGQNLLIDRYIKSNEHEKAFNVFEKMKGSHIHN